MATDLIQKIEKMYMEKMQNMIEETMNSFLQSGRVWQKKKETIATDISDCFNHLIIPDDVLKKSLQPNQYRQFKDIQIEIIEEYEYFNIVLVKESDTADEYVLTISKDGKTVAAAPNNGTEFGMPTTGTIAIDEHAVDLTALKTAVKEFKEAAIAAAGDAQ